MNKEIKVTISLEGKVTVAASGFAGKECLEATKNLEKALGSVDNRTDTKEMLKSEKGRVEVKR